ncbi:MAG: tetratricopeptide repeat protein [Eubacteriales bacterium]|nr:tetratricopeptide repeat protein [Eubacteriales bacterium]
MCKEICPESGEKIWAQKAFRQGAAHFAAYRYWDALPLFRQAAQAGHPQAMRCLGWFLENGYCVPADVDQAARWYAAASEAGDGLASGCLAVLWDGVTADFPTDYREAFRLYRLSIAQGGATGTTYNNLAVLYMNGTGTESDPAMAERLLRKAMSLGNPLAGSNLEVLADSLSPFRCPRCGSLDIRRGRACLCRGCGLIFP